MAHYLRAAYTMKVEPRIRTKRRLRSPHSFLQTILPTRAIALLVGIGFIDLVTTAILHANGSIVEMNPLMRAFLVQSEWLFVLVKGSTLVAAWWVMAIYSRQHLAFVRKTCLIGSAVYLLVWLMWFTVGATA